jgi:NitT/TauT family transport system substrate-binding protein
MNNALISDSIDIVAGGVPGLLTLWNRTHGTANEVKGISALSSQPFLLNTRSENIKSIADLKDSDRIAVPAVKVSVQAVTLQMAAAKLFGEKNFGKLDPLTVSMSPPDSTIALLTGTGEINNVFGVPPFQQQQLGEARHPHHPEFLRRDGRPAHLHGGVDQRPLPRERIRCSTRR